MRGFGSTKAIIPRVTVYLEPYFLLSPIHITATAVRVSISEKHSIARPRLGFLCYQYYNRAQVL